MIRHLAIWLVVFLAGCAVQPATVVVPQSAATGAVVPVFVATNRALDAGSLPLESGAGPLAFARYQVSDPPARPLGDVPMARGVPDPAENFAIAGAEPFATRPDFVNSLRAELAARPAGQRSVLVYVHGYFVSFAEGLFRTAQVARDLNIRHLPLHFAWPSAPTPLGYADDRDSVLASRDDLEATLDAIARAGAERIVILGHSLGSQLVTETLRQISISGRSDLMRRIDGVFLVSPDIGLNVFRSEIARVPDLPDPFVVFASRRDRVLAISSGLYGLEPRLGGLEDFAAIRDPRIQVVDMSGFREGYTGHRAAMASPEFLRLVAARRGGTDALARVLSVLLGD